MSVVGIVTALAAEARAFALAERRQGAPAALADGSLLAVGGIGFAAAAAAARTLIEAGARALASWGMAGGLDPAMRAGTIFLPCEVISRDGSGYATAPRWRARLSAAVAALEPVARGKLLSSAYPIDAVAGKAAAFRETGAAAVDMESLAVAEVAAAHRLPFIAVRVIIDTASDTLPGAVLAATRSGEVKIWRLAAALALAPADLGPLIRLAQRYRLASRSLAALARAGPLAPLAFANGADPGRP